MIEIYLSWRMALGIWTPNATWNNVVTLLWEM